MLSIKNSQIEFHGLNIPVGFGGDISAVHGVRGLGRVRVTLTGQVPFQQRGTSKNKNV